MVSRPVGEAPVARDPAGARPAADRTRGRLGAALLFALLLGAAFIGRAVISIDGAEILSVSLGCFVTGRLEAAMPPSPEFLAAPAFHSHYGPFPSLLPLPFLAVSWPLRRWIGAAGLDACVALTWSAGALLCSLGFLRLARVFRPGLSPLWGPAFLAGTFLWPYAADSFFDPYSAGAFAFAAAGVLSRRDPAPSRLAAASLLWSAGCWLRPVLWVTAPVFLLAAILHVSRCERAASRALAALGGLAGGLAIALAVNWLYQGSPFHFGYVLSPDLPFWNPLGSGLFGLTLSPGRGLVFFAPLVVLAPFQFRRLPAAARILCFGTGAVLAVVIARWFVWNGGSCWGPRYLIPALPLLAAPAVLASGAARRAAVAAGCALNLAGVVVSPGAFISYVGLLVPPPGVEWPAHGPDRVSSVPALSPLAGHVWFLADAAAPGRWQAPWLKEGAREGTPRPRPSEFVSPWVVRRALGLAPVGPFTPRLLARTAAAYLVRDRPHEARLFAQEALALDPGDAQARSVLAAVDAPR